jgi:tRNA(adenine34) deaminase
MSEAIKEARAAADGEVPIGCVIVKGGNIIARAANEKETRKLATAHAEMLAIAEASRAADNWYLEGCTLYVTLEPCAMCAGAIVAARLDRVVFGAYDKRFGACGTLFNIASDARLNHRAEVVGGVLEKDCAGLLSDFFKERRKRGQDG